MPVVFSPLLSQRFGRLWLAALLAALGAAFAVVCPSASATTRDFTTPSTAATEVTSTTPSETSDTAAGAINAMPGATGGIDAATNPPPPVTAPVDTPPVTRRR